MCALKAYRLVALHRLAPYGSLHTIHEKMTLYPPFVFEPKFYVIQLKFYIISLWQMIFCITIEFKGMSFSILTQIALI